MTNTAETKSSNSALPKGEISGVNGPVVDVAFQKDSLPRIREALFVVINGKKRVMEVAQHIGGGLVRCIMLGLPKGFTAGWRFAPQVRRFRFPSEMQFSEGFSMFSENAWTAENRCLPKRNEEAFTALPRPMPKDRQPKKFLKPVLRLSTCLPRTKRAVKSAFSAVQA